MDTAVAGTIFAERFRLERVVGAGGHGQVWRAHDLARGVPVAVKLRATTGDPAVDKEADRRLSLEAAIVAGLDHPGIVAYVAHGVTAAGAPYLVEEWLDGPTLRAIVRARGLTVAEALALVERVARIVGGAHAAGVVHRDLKPENVIIVGGDLAAPRLIDFGLSRTPRVPGLTRSGVVLGSVGYLAPEQARGDAAIDARADVFALGCLLYECASGRAAFAGSGLIAVSAKVQFTEPVPLDVWCPEAEALAPLLRRLLAKAPGDRPADGVAAAALIATTPRPTGPRRPVSDEAPTLPLARADAPATIVVALGPERLDAEAQARWGWVAATWDGPGTALPIEVGVLAIRFEQVAAGAAVAAARRLRAALGGVTLAIATSGARTLLDVAAALAERAALADAFVAGPGPIRLDAATALRLAPAEVTRVGAAWQLREPR